MRHPSQPLTEIPTWQQAIRDKCHHASGTFIEFTKEDIEQSIPDRFEQIVRMYPNRLAVKTRSHQLTYDELNKAANRVAHAIVDRRGRGPEPIALLIGNIVPALIALLGILKSGKFYVPLDPLFPDTRTAYMLDDCQAELIVTTSGHTSLASHLAQNGLQVLNSAELEPNCPTANPGLPIPADALAYLLYTSGSSGQPKGVTENHRNLLHEIMGLTNDFHICREDRITLLNSLSFSGSARSVYGSLLNGASLFPYDIRERGLGKLASWLMDESITIFRSGPTVFRQFVETLTGQEQFPTLRLITTGGEAALKTDVELYKKHFSADCILVNGLRTTETGSVRHYFVDKATEIPEATVPVGYPMQDTTILVLDDDGREVPRNEVGELAVRSRYLSPGYWRRPTLTQARFLPDPTGGEERTYLTGDLGVMQADGCLLHLGRKDSQIKIRDQRVEPAEVEEALLALEAVKEAVVDARDGEPGQQRLVAYIVPQPQAAPTTSALRRALSEKLPEYMIPFRFVVLDALPLTPTGKVDRRALPEIGTARPALDSPWVAPRTPVEKQLANLWADLLRVDAVGIDDSFQDLGGDSLKAVELLVAVERAFGVELAVEAMYGAAATVSKMAAEIERLRAACPLPNPPPCSAQGREIRTSLPRPAQGREPSSVSSFPSRSAQGRESFSVSFPRLRGKVGLGASGGRAIVCADDLVTLLTLLGLAPVAWFLPRTAWPTLCDALARAYVALRGLPAKDLEEALTRLNVQLTSDELQRRFLSGVYQDIVMTLREHLPVAWRPAIRLLGAEHISAARAAGRGAVLWSCPSPFGGLISKRALKAAGVELVNLRSSIHPYSGTVFGMKMLNPIRTRIEDRYLAGTVTLEDAEGLGALQELRVYLEANAVITIAANGSEGTPFRMPFLGGTLKLSLGAPTLAALQGAPLLPVFTAADGAGGFEVIVGPPVEAKSSGYAGETARELARAYAKILEAHLRRHPTEWRGWFMRHTWSSDKCLN